MRKYTKAERKLVNSTWFLIFVIVGAAMNMTAITSNGGKMPVKYDSYFESDYHFAFQDYSEIERPLFVDRIIIKIKSSKVIFSIGDIFAIVGLIGFIYNLISFRRIKKREDE